MDEEESSHSQICRRRHPRFRVSAARESPGERDVCSSWTDWTGRGRLAAKERVLKVVILVLCCRRQGVEGIVLLIA